jgi:AcrR family transcriptional regulator
MERTMRAGTRRRGKRTARVSPGDRRRRLLDAASRVFLKRGYARARVQDVAREAKVARGTFYAHFDSKRHVLEVLARGWLEALLPPVGPYEVSDLSSLERALREVHGRALAAFANDAGPARLLFGDEVGDEVTRGKGLARALADHEREWRRRIGLPVVLAKASGCLRDGVDVERTSECVLGMVSHVARRLPRAAGPEEVAAWTALVTRLHLAAVS